MLTTFIGWQVKLRDVNLVSAARGHLMQNGNYNQNLLEVPTFETCRLCDGQASYVFSGVILDKNKVNYFRCSSCDSLQVENPYWLDEAYLLNLSNLDTGVAQRTLNNFAACYALSKFFRYRNILDFGGGDGLFCRLMRDFSFNCYVQDKFASPTYAQGYTEPDFDEPDIVTAFEVAEHFANPKEEIEQLFYHKPKVVILSTALYAGQGPNWWYLSTESGQHVFFYSLKAMKQLARTRGYQLIYSGGYCVFIESKSYSAYIGSLVWFLLKGKLCRLMLSLILLMPARGVVRDYKFQSSRARGFSD